jgi:hypothetical protein
LPAASGLSPRLSILQMAHDDTVITANTRVSCAVAIALTDIRGEDQDVGPGRSDRSAVSRRRRSSGPSSVDASPQGLVVQNRRAWLALRCHTVNAERGHDERRAASPGRRRQLFRASVAVTSGDGVNATASAWSSSPQRAASRNTLSRPAGAVLRRWLGSSRPARQDHFGR